MKRSESAPSRASRKARPSHASKVRRKGLGKGTPLAGISEDRLLEKLVQPLPAIREGSQGIGDDCAVIPHGHHFLLLKTDALVEDVHFLRTQPPVSVGWKALCRTLSDIASMGGQPREALVTFASPSEVAVDWWTGFYKGIGRAAKRFGVDIVGGESTRSPSGIFVSIAAAGWADRPVMRSGGKPGDRLFVTGSLGGSGAGHHLRFTPRIDEGQWLARRQGVVAMMDLSDGLGTDLPRMADAGKTGYSVDLEHLPRRKGCTIEEALSDGEDYELLIAVKPRAAVALKTAWQKRFPRVRLTEIGQLEEEGIRTDMASGFDHFSHCQKRGKSRQ